LKQSKQLFFIFLLLVTVRTWAQSVGIGTLTPVASAQLDITSNNKGFLPPRMTKAQRDAIATPVQGLMIWCNNCVAPSGELQVFNGTSWTNMAGGSSPSGTVTICMQVWAIKNLDVDRYRNGDPIPKVTDPTAWSVLTTGAYCYYNNDSATYAATYGKLYNGYAVNDPRGLAPEGWHIPSNDEWNILVKCIDPAADTTCSVCSQSTIAGGAMKETGTTHWTAPNNGATNSSGFTGLPGGYRINTGNFITVGSYGGWWSSTDFSTTYTWSRRLNYNSSDIFRDFSNKPYGFSVRCLRD
jgi:uncharacterized protein (TIGR02145 family)